MLTCDGLRGGVQTFKKKGLSFSPRFFLSPSTFSSFSSSTILRLCSSRSSQSFSFFFFFLFFFLFFLFSFLFSFRRSPPFPLSFLCSFVSFFFLSILFSFFSPSIYRSCILWDLPFILEVGVPCSFTAVTVD